MAVEEVNMGDVLRIYIEKGFDLADRGVSVFAKKLEELRNIVFDKVVEVLSR